MSKSKQIHVLSDANWKIGLKYLNNILAKIFTAINNDKPLDDELYQNILDIIYQCFEEVYLNTVKELESIYKDLKDFEIDNVSELTYKEDGKTLDERVKSYLDEVSSLNSQLTSKELISFKFYRLMRTEVSYLENAIKRKKISISADVMVIEGTCNCNGICDKYVGVYAIDENLDFPPYHPNCTCICYPDQSDDIDDLKDNDIIEREWYIDIK